MKIVTTFQLVIIILILLQWVIDMVITALKLTSIENGVDVYSTLPKGKYGRLSGSSMSTAIRTGKLI